MHVDPCAGWSSVSPSSMLCQDPENPGEAVNPDQDGYGVALSHTAVVVLVIYVVCTLGCIILVAAEH